MQITAIYPGTFDPVTNGHLDLIARASKLYDTLIVGVAANIRKTPLFTLEERIGLLQSVVVDHPNIQVIGFKNLLVDFANEHQARVILRGLRTVSDFEYEFQLARVNRRLSPKLETIFLMPAEYDEFISSTMTREIAKLKGDISSFVPPIVEQSLIKKFT
ncbi:MAG: pantetheine-phosphate adenylyltransferase [Methylococcales bacterium]|nr:pantetheine-phosphate adenylyltransferase [Methylococcales bacterium]